MYKYITIFLLLALVGFLMLRDKRPVSANAEEIINAPIEKVWRLQTNLYGWKDWNPDIESMKIVGDIGIGTSFVWKAGGITIESKITEFIPNSKIGWHGKTFGINAEHIWVFTETESGVRVYTEEVFTGPLAWLLPGTMRAQIDKALKHGVSVLKATAENKPAQP